MISRDLTNLYLKDFNVLSEAVYMCWHNSFCQKTKQINEEKLRAQIRLHGFYQFKNKHGKALPLSFRDRLKFKAFGWANCITNSIPEYTLPNRSEIYLKAITEVEQNLLLLRNKNERIAYAKMLINAFNKGHIYNLDVDEHLLNFRLKELFLYVIDHNFVKEDNVTGMGFEEEVYPVYKLTVELINHFDFIDKLISAFIYFDISIARHAREANCNLFMFQDTLSELNATYNKQSLVTPKFHSYLSDDCLIKIMHYLISKNLLENTNSDIWLYWFNRKSLNSPETLKWNKSNTLLSNIIQHLCGESIALTVKTAFHTKIHVKPTKSKYERSCTYKEIEQIITISKQKNA
jgi:hypothetical protein